MYGLDDRIPWFSHCRRECTRLLDSSASLRARVIIQEHERLQ